MAFLCSGEETFNQNLAENDANDPTDVSSLKHSGNHTELILIPRSDDQLDISNLTMLDNNDEQYFQPSKVLLKKIYRFWNRTNIF